MILSRLTLLHFRSYPKQHFSFDPATTLIVGANTAGKTNILEAVYFLATGKSFRAEHDRDVIAWGSEITSVKGDVPSGDSVEIKITTGEVAGIKAPPKKYLVNAVPRRQVDFVGNVRAVLFWPEDLDLVSGSPGLRRRYLDSVLVQTDREYRRTLGSYERGIRQRNKLLFLIHEGKATRSQLLFWDQLLIKAGGYITDARMKLIDYINKQGIGERVQGSEKTYRIIYDKSVISESRLEQYKDAEVGAKVTLVGPHRDDFIVEKQYGGAFRDVRKFGSRGEQRLAVLWLKLAELAYIEKETGERPILLLDDIFSELDPEHRALVLDLVGKQQTILTSAEEEVVELLQVRKIEAHIIRL